MIALFALIAINCMSVYLLTGCGEKEKQNDANTNPGDKTLDRTDTTVEMNFTKQTKTEIDAKTMRGRVIRADVYHEAAINMAYPASIRCRNHDDTWRILALYLDYIRAVNPTEFAKYRLLDAALAVLHDFNQYLTQQSATYSNTIVAISIIYFLIEFHRIKINMGNDVQPWYKMLCANVNINELETLKTMIANELVGIPSEAGGSGSPTVNAILQVTNSVTTN